MGGRIPDNILRLGVGEDTLRAESLALIQSDARLALHLDVISHVMDLVDVLRQFPTEDDDLKVIQVLGMRIFNAFASSIKLVLSGYSQTSALILRDILECTFLIDLFMTDHAAITRWRTLDKKARLKEFAPVKVRDSLDKRDGFTKKKRAEFYSLLSELAGHPSMASFAMLRPKAIDIRPGPFVEPQVLEATVTEMGNLAVQAGEKFASFLPECWGPGIQIRTTFNIRKRDWLKEFYVRG